MSADDLLDFGEIRAGAKDMVDAVRQNHALEHATVAILQMRKEGRVRLVGRAGPSGFYIYGDIPTEVMEQAVNEALSRLQAGEKSLAVSPFCGTNLVVSGLSAALASMIAGKGHRGFDKFMRMAEASILATIVAQPLGRLTRKHLTTLADMHNVAIAGIEKTGSGKRTCHRVEIVRK